MTNSMIPYSFIPGTKANAGEVNANFIALAETVATNKALSSQALSDLQILIENLNNTKLNKSDFFDKVISSPGEDLNDYKTKGVYIFTENTFPQNTPQGDLVGTLTVTGSEDLTVKQVWKNDNDLDTTYTRTYRNETWSEWASGSAIDTKGYCILDNGLILQWGITHLIARGSSALIEHSTVMPNGTLNVQITPFVFSGSTHGDKGSLTWLAYQYSCEGFTILNRHEEAAIAFSWFAIGY